MLDYLSIAVATAVRLGADVVSNSYGIPEFPGMLSLGRKYLTHPKVPILAATGDVGYTFPAFPAFPASLPGVWAIGGTTLKHTPTVGWLEMAWRHSGSGCSVYAARPAGQHSPDGRNCRKRMTADISAVADATQKFAVYDTYGHPGVYTDILTGANGYCQTSLCQAGLGYDGPTGLGSPHHLRGCDQMLPEGLIELVVRRDGSRPFPGQTDQQVMYYF